MTQLAEMETKAQGLVDIANSKEVTNQLQYDASADFLQNCQLLRKKIGKFFEATIQNFKDAKAKAEKGRKEEVAKMDKYCEPVEIAIDIVRKKCKAFEDAEELKRIEAQEKADEEAEKKEELNKKWGSDEEVEAEEVKPTIAKTAGLGISRRWQFEITNEMEIPREWLVPDLVKIGKYCREQKENASVKGIKFYKD